MKNAMLNVSVLFMVLVAVGCDSSGNITSGTTGISINNPAPITGGLNCTASANGTGGVLTTCNNGMTITADSTALALTKGSAGAVGPTGAAGPTSQLVLIDANGHQVGDELIGPAAENIGSVFSVWDNTNGVEISYISNTAVPYTATIYYTTTNCTGQAYVQKTLMQNTVYSNGNYTELYAISSTTATITPESNWTTFCQTAAAANGVYSEANSYSNANVPMTLALPVRVVKQ